MLDLRVSETLPALDGRFELGPKIGAGGMGAVYEALDRETGEKVAVKLLTSHSEVDAERFRREATYLATLRDPSIVRYIAHGSYAKADRSEPSPWIAMEWLEGETLSSRIVGGLHAAEAIRIIRDAARAVGVAHAQGLIHRDIKPANLFLVTGESAVPTLKVLDFGIARPLAAGNTLTMTGTAIGTPFSMAPEQARGDRDLDARVDTYALGCVLYECLCGVRPFEADTPIAVLAKILLEDPTPLEDRIRIPDALAKLMHRLLSKDRTERPANGAELAAALDALGSLEGLPGVRARTQSLGTQEQRLVCAVMVASLGDGEATQDVIGPALTERGNPSGAPPLPRDEALTARAAEFEGNAIALADGSLVCTFSGRGAATDRAERAAALALAWREIVRDAAIVVIAGRAPVGAQLPAAEVVDRGVERLRSTIQQRAGVRGIGIDEGVDGFLDERFVREGPRGHRVLHSFVEHGLTGRTVLGSESPFVGRRRELATLSATFEECDEESVSRVVLVRGEAGAGKSRLVQRLLRSLPPHRSFVANAESLRASSPFSTIAAALLRTAELSGGEPLAVRRARFAERISAVCDDASVALFLGEVSGIPFDEAESPALAAARRDPILMGDAVRTSAEAFFRAECGRGPVVLVLEDMQWCDRPSVGLVDHLLRRLADCPLLVMTTARDDVDEVYPSLFAQRDLLEVPLGRLSPKASAKLIEATWPDSTPEIVERIVGHAEGHPFTIEELVRAASSGGGELPLTVLAVVESRLDALDADARRVLRAASVFGLQAWSGGIDVLVGGDCGGWLTQLDGDALLQSHANSRYDGEREVSFRHALVRDAAYGMLPPKDAALGHRLAGLWLASGRESDPAVVADHLRRSDQPETAASYDAKAARRALDAGDFETALEYAIRAAESPDDITQGAAYLVQCEAHRWMANYAEAAAAASSAMVLLPAGSSAWFQAMGTQIASAGTLRRPLDGLGHQCLQTAPSSDAVVDKVICLCRLAHESLGLGRFSEARDFAAEADALALFVVDTPTGTPGGEDDTRPLSIIPGGSLVPPARRSSAPTMSYQAIDHEGLEDAAAQAWLHTTRAALALADVRTSAYLGETRAAIEAYDRAGDARQACNQRVRLGYGLLEIGQWDAAEAMLRRALVDARRLGLGMIEGFALQNLGHALALRGHLEEGAQFERDAIVLGKKLGHPVVEGGARYYCGRISRWQGQLAEAVAEGRRALDCVEEIPPLRTLCLAELARAYAAQGNAVDALRFAEEAQASADTLASMPEANIHIYSALLDAGADVLDEAQAWLGQRAERLSAEHRGGFDEVPDHRRIRGSAG